MHEICSILWWLHYILMYIHYDYLIGRDMVENKTEENTLELTNEITAYLLELCLPCKLR